MFFDNWEGIIRTVTIGVLAYVLLIAMLRTSGKRTLAKMNAFDLVVTVALGSTFATVLLSEDVALTEGATAFLVLIGLQLAVTTAAMRLRPVRDAVKSTPRALLLDGTMDAAALREERVTPEEVLAAVRAGGLGDLTSVAAVVLETDGSFTVVPIVDRGDGSALSTVRGIH
jgi:uncharacterized membrane protein YcaP (DUF421 family)